MAEGEQTQILYVCVNNYYCCSKWLLYTEPEFSYVQGARATKTMQAVVHIIVITLKTSSTCLIKIIVQYDTENLVNTGSISKFIERKC